MPYLRSGTTIGGLAIFFSLIALVLAPHSYRVPGIMVIYLSLVAAAIIEHYVSPKRMWDKTRKAASCGCDKAMKEVAKVPAFFQSNCSMCGGEMA